MKPLDDIFTEIPADHRSGFVAVIGRPNAGKSTLINAFMRQKIAIVAPRPQTTRIRQLGILTEPGYQMIFVDTPGIIKEAKHKLDAFMLETAQESLKDADMILWVLDAGEMPGEVEKTIAQTIQSLPNPPTIFLAINKSDLAPAEEVLEITGRFRKLAPDADWFFISALNNLGTDELQNALIDQLPAGPRYFPPDQITEAFLRDIAAEMIREQALILLRDEIPHGIAVQVTEFKERDNGSAYIAGTLFVERENHKRIVIGKKGAMLKKIGARARIEIETLLDNKAYLELWVKVAPKWRQDERALKRFGYAAKK